MKKILFIFVLSLYSIQGFASNTYDSFPVHEFAKSPLRDLKVTENWRLFKNPSELKLFHEKFKNKNREKHSYAPYFAKCEQAISEFDIEIHKSFDIDRAFFYFNCKKALSHNHYQNREKGIKVFERILLLWAKNKPIDYPDKNIKNSHADIAYAATMLVGDFASFYAVYYDDFNFNKEQRQAVDDYLSDWLINYDLEPTRDRKICNLEAPETFEIEGHDAFGIYADYCGSNRWRLGLGAVYLGLRTGNQRLFTAGNRHIEINLATIDKDGIFPMWARKGALALSYQRQLPEVLTLLALAYESIGYDFYEHQLPHGKKIHEVYEALFDFIYHPEKLNKYAFARWDYVGQDAYAFDKLPIKEKWRREYIYPVVLAAQSKGYILEYRPDLMSMAEYTVNDWYKYDLDFVALFTNVSGVAIYESVNQTVSIEAEKRKEKKRIEAAKKKEEKRIEAEKKKEKKRVDAEKYQERLKVEKDRLRVEAEVEAEACKISPLNGEYEARWIRDHWRDIGEWEFVGSEPLILDQCEGEFEGIKQFDPRPTPAVRKKLIVKYQTNGEISIKGDLNLYGIDDLRYTGLYGNIHDGEISGIWGVRDRLKIELIKK